MAVYGYRCPTHGGYDVQHPIGTAPEREPCPRCQVSGTRAYSSVMLGRTPRAVVTAMDRAGTSSDTPEVVTSLPARGRPPVRVSTHPAHRSLPRP